MNHYFELGNTEEISDKLNDWNNVFVIKRRSRTIITVTKGYNPLFRLLTIFLLEFSQRHYKHTFSIVRGTFIELFRDHVYLASDVVVSEISSVMHLLSRILLFAMKKLSNGRLIYISFVISFLFALKGPFIFYTCSFTSYKVIADIFKKI